MRERTTLKLLRALIGAGVAIDANAIPDRSWRELLLYHTPTVLAVSHGTDGPTGALFVVYGRLYAVVGRTGRLLQLL